MDYRWSDAFGCFTYMIDHMGRFGRDLHFYCELFLHSENLLKHLILKNNCNIRLELVVLAKSFSLAIQVSFISNGHRTIAIVAQINKILEAKGRPGVSCARLVGANFHNNLIIK